MAEPDFNIGVMGMKLANGEVGTVLAGIAGSFISLRFLGPMPWWERLIVVVCGGVVTHYFTPLATHFLGLEKYPAEVGFVVGVFGMSFIYAGLALLSAFRANPLDWLRVVMHRQGKP